MKQVKRCSPDIQDFDPRKAIEIWHGDSVCTRRPNFVRKGKNGTDLNGGSESECEVSSENSDDVNL